MIGIDRDEAAAFLSEQHGITHGGNKFVELPCVVKSYPNRDGYLNDTIDRATMKTNIAQGGGGGHNSARLSLAKTLGSDVARNDSRATVA